jgi:hypothetical protein
LISYAIGKASIAPFAMGYVAATRLYKMPQEHIFSDLKVPRDFGLMIILPEEHITPWQCTISEFQPQTPLPYEALSYALGAFHPIMT